MVFLVNSPCEMNHWVCLRHGDIISIYNDMGNQAIIYNIVIDMIL